MKHVLTLLATLALAPFALAAAAYAADAKPLDPDYVRLQAAEAALRAGATRTPSAVIRNAPVPRTSDSSDGAPARGKSADGYFPLPARAAADPRPRGGVDALLATATAKQAAKPAPQLPTPDDAATAEGLAAIESFRHDRGLNR